MSDSKEQDFLEKANEKLISVLEAARYSKLTPVYVRSMLRQGRIQGVKKGRDWFTTEDALRAFLESNRNVGRPKKEE